MSIVSRWTDLIILVALVALVAFLRPVEQQAPRRERGRSIEQLLDGRPDEAWSDRNATILMRSSRAVILEYTKCSIDASAWTCIADSQRVVLQSVERPVVRVTFTSHKTARGQFLEDMRFPAMTRGRNGRILYDRCFQRCEVPVKFELDLVRMPPIPEWPDSPASP